jgi:pimeloyl-ACP methyl ester carboxylesterase
MSEQFRAVHAANRWVEVGGRMLAYRSIGSGKPILLCARCRGSMDSWDPAFLDALAANGLRVLTFDYSGSGYSGGTPARDPFDLARDARDLMQALDLRDAVIGGWSLGGLAAQALLALYPERISHAALIATAPPGSLVKAGEQRFFDTAALAEHTLEDEALLYFAPRSAASRAAHLRSRARLALRASGRSPEAPASQAAALLGAAPRNPVFADESVLAALRRTTLPLLHIGADHDIGFPVENWYALSGQLPTLQLLTFPSAGHAPQHQYPEAAASYIATFARSAVPAPPA